MTFDEWWDSPNGWLPCDGARAISRRAFQEGAASRDAEIQRLQFALADSEALELGTAERCDQLRAELAAEQANNTRLRDFIASAQVSSGVCCCGEAMDGHSSPMSCGHSPVDMWDHAVEKLLHAPSDTSALEAIVKKAGEVMRERVVETILASAHGFPMREIRILPAVTLEDLK